MQRSATIDKASFQGSRRPHHYEPFEGRDTYERWDGLRWLPMLEATPEEELEAEEAEAGR